MTTGQSSKNKRMAAIFAFVAIGMVGASFAAVPLYKIFCQVTGFGGTTRRATQGADQVLERTMTIRFDSTVAQGLPWTFKPEQNSQTIHVGESSIAFFKAVNNSKKPVTGRAAFNVSPAKAGIYFKKIQCFCFTEQTLQPGEAADMPVTYFIDPAIADDPDLDDVETVTLAYTFFPWGDDDASDGGSAAE